MTNLQNTKELISNLKYVNDIGDGKRKERCHNIALALLNNYFNLTESERTSGRKFVSKGILRDFILGKTRLHVKDKIGDRRAHGDACGGHGLHLGIEGRGSKAIIYFNEENMTKCADFLSSNVNEVILK